MSLEQKHRKIFIKCLRRKYVSTASIQRDAHVSFTQANEILNQLVAAGYASPRIGLYPCTVLSGRFKRIKSIKAEYLTRCRILIPSVIYVLRVWRIKMTVKYLKRL